MELTDPPYRRSAPATPTLHNFGKHMKANATTQKKQKHSSAAAATTTTATAAATQAAALVHPLCVTPNGWIYATATDFSAMIFSTSYQTWMDALLNPQQTALITNFLVSHVNTVKHYQFGPAALRVYTEPNAGGASEFSEALSFELIHRMCQHIELRQTEMQIEYEWAEWSKKTDYSITLHSAVLGVSVTRALNYRGGDEAFSVEDGRKLLYKKLFGVQQSNKDVVDKFTKQILHIFTSSENIVRILQEVYVEFLITDPHLVGNTVVLITLAKNAPFIYFNFSDGVNNNDMHDATTTTTTTTFTTAAAHTTAARKNIHVTSLNHAMILPCCRVARALEQQHQQRMAGLSCDDSIPQGSRYFSAEPLCMDIALDICLADGVDTKGHKGASVKYPVGKPGKTMSPLSLDADGDRYDVLNYDGKQGELDMRQLHDAWEFHEDELLCDFEEDVLLDNYPGGSPQKASTTPLRSDIPSVHHSYECDSDSESSIFQVSSQAPHTILSQQYERLQQKEPLLFQLSLLHYFAFRHIYLSFFKLVSNMMIAAAVSSTYAAQFQHKYPMTAVWYHYTPSQDIMLYANSCIRQPLAHRYTVEASS